MKLTQLSLFLENRPGRLRAVCQALAEHGINILTLSLADTREFGILRLVVADWQAARRVLEEAGWIVNVAEVVAVEVEDRPGGLAQVLARADEAGLEVEYMYAFTFGRGDRAVLVFRFSDPDAAVAALRSHGVNVVGDIDLFDRARPIAQEPPG
jgi:hypothetical protein